MMTQTKTIAPKYGLQRISYKVGGLVQLFWTSPCRTYVFWGEHEITELLLRRGPRNGPFWPHCLFTGSD